MLPPVYGLWRKGGGIGDRVTLRASDRVTPFQSCTPRLRYGVSSELLERRSGSVCYRPSPWDSHTLSITLGNGVTPCVELSVLSSPVDWRWPILHSAIVFHRQSPKLVYLQSPVDWR
jgi:hypothetical protein